MSLEVMHFESREEWLEARDGIKGIGGSDAAAACGISKRKTKAQLWKEKTGRAKPKDLSGVDYVQLGVKIETPMRELFTAFHPELIVEHFPYDIFFQRERPWCFATLDGALTDRARGDKGVLEIKKFDVKSRDDWKQWDGRVPDEYFFQVMHQLSATGFSFAYLWALLRHTDGSCSLREYYFPREEHEDDLAEIMYLERNFMDFLESGRIPPVNLTLP